MIWILSLILGAMVKDLLTFADNNINNNSNNNFDNIYDNLLKKEK